MKPWKTLHQKIAGMMIDRETAHPDLMLEMQPLGTQLDRKDQRRRLVITIVDSPEDVATVLDENGIALLAAFLKLRP